MSSIDDSHRSARAPHWVPQLCAGSVVFFTWKHKTFEYLCMVMLIPKEKNINQPHPLGHEPFPCLAHSRARMFSRQVQVLDEI